MKKMLFLTALFVGFGLAISYQPAQAAGCTPDNIVFSEIDYDQPGTDTAEFLELYLPNAVTITNCEIRFINGSNNTEYNTVSIAGTYAAGKYLTLGVGGDIPIGTCTTNCIQNGAPDGFALVDTSGGSVNLVWFYSYEGPISGYDPGDGSSNTSTDLGVSENGSSPNRSLINGPAAGVGDVTNTTNVTPGAANVDDSGSPTAIALASLTASSQSSLGLVALLGVVLSSGVWAVLRRKKR